MQDILDLIIFCIIFAFVWHMIMNSQHYAYEEYENLFDEDEENLTMEEKPITIILENYNNTKITFTMSPDAIVESMFEMNPTTMKIDRVHIDAKACDIAIEKEEFTE